MDEIVLKELVVRILERGADQAGTPSPEEVYLLALEVLERAERESQEACAGVDLPRQRPGGGGGS